MAKHVISDNFSPFSYQSKADNGGMVRREAYLVGWVIDDESLKPEPVFYDKPKKGETLVFKQDDSFVEVK